MEQLVSSFGDPQWTRLVNLSRTSPVLRRSSLFLIGCASVFLEYTDPLSQCGAYRFLGLTYWFLTPFQGKEAPSFQHPQVLVGPPCCPHANTFLTLMTLLLLVPFEIFYWLRMVIMVTLTSSWIPGSDHHQLRLRIWWISSFFFSSWWQPKRKTTIVFGAKRLRLLSSAVRSRPFNDTVVYSILTP